MADKHSKGYVKTFMESTYNSFIPNKSDTVKSGIIKIVFIISLFTLIISSVYLINYFANGKKQKEIIKNDQKIWHEEILPKEDKVAKLRAENSDFKGWISIPNALVDNAVYQTDNNDYYLTHNQKKEKSVYGALFFDYQNKIEDFSSSKNLVIYGHEMKDGQMFGTLKKFKNIDFYKANPTINLSTLYVDSTYKIFSVMILNADMADDNDYIFNCSKSLFVDDDEFKSWSDEAYQRSLINTGVDIEITDDFLTLITCTEDIKNGRLIIMARRTRENETSIVDTSKAVINPSPRYPKRWYDDRKKAFPY